MKNSARIGFIKVGFWIGILILLNSCHPSMNYDTQAEIDSIVAKWVPDKREGICNVSVTINKDGAIILKGETTIPQAGQEIINALSKPGIVLIDSILLLPDTLDIEKHWGLVTLSVINFRKQPDHRSELVSQAIMGTPVRILKTDNWWVLIQTPDKYIAWTEKSSVESLSREELTSWKQRERVIFLNNNGSIYSAPEVPEVVGDLTAGSIMEKKGESNGFIKVALPDGREGYVETKKLMDFRSWKEQVFSNDEKIIEVAATFLGFPYLWGGSSSKAVDCSGLVQSVYFMNGIIISRDASLQEHHGLVVDFSNGFNELKMGDLLFFGSKDSNGSHVSHVAIYKGDNEYIHSSGRVMINSLDFTQINYNSYRRNSLLSVKRIVGVENDNGIVPVNKHPWY
ncbi:MAG TPA: NlpC/P60 family protein [Bacteroidales bacterium]|nr:NlpC/P60 family protein [Bacteroidales bacterium]